MAGSSRQFRVRLSGMKRWPCSVASESNSYSLLFQNRASSPVSINEVFLQPSGFEFLTVENRYNLKALTRKAAIWLRVTIPLGQ